MFVMVLNDYVVSVFVMMGVVVFGWCVLWGYWIMVSSSFIFIIIVWVIDWVYYYIVNGWVNIVLMSCIGFIDLV